MSDALMISEVEPSTNLRILIHRAADSLVCAVTAAEVLDARDQASFAYDAAKAALRLAKAKRAHDDVVARVYRAQADALEIESLAKRRLADEVDAAQDRGELAGHGGKRGNQHVAKVSDDTVATTADVGLTRPQVFEARQIRDAIEREPGILRRVLDDILVSGEEPTKAKLRRELAPAVNIMRAQANTEKKERRTAKEIALAGKIRALPNKRYGVIYADPEWRFEPYSRESGMDRAPDNHYPTSATADIAARDVASIAADDCVLFLWATAPMLLDAADVMKAWGFTYKSHAIWHKERTGDGRGTGYWFLGDHEVLMVGTKGNIPAPAMGTQARSVFGAPVGEHSAKPETALEIIEAYFPNLPKIELNRRGPPRPGWDGWGLEAEDEVAPAPTAIDDPDLLARARAVVCAMPDEFGRMLRATKIAESLGQSWETAVELADRIEAEGPFSLADKLMATGFVPNAYILELNRGLTNPNPCDLPSRLFRFPVEYMDEKRTGGEARLLLRHPLLFQYLPVADFLDAIEEKTGVRPEWSDTDEFGRDFGSQGRWWHAVDLCTDKHWEGLLKTRQFTDADATFGAMQLSLEGKSLSLKNARALMKALDSAEPDKAVSLEGLCGKALSPYRHDKGKLISPNIRERGEASAWMIIHGLEDKMLSFVGSHLSVTEACMARRETVKEIEVPLPLGDEGAE